MPSLSSSLPHYHLFRAVGFALAYLFICTFAQVMAYLLRFDFDVPYQYVFQLYNDWAWVIALKLFFLLAFGQFAEMLSFFNLPDARRLFYAVSCSAAVLLASRYVTDTYLIIPKGVILLDWILSYASLAGFRLCLRVWREHTTQTALKRRRRTKDVCLVGAGDVGGRLALDLPHRPGTGLRPVAFFDDDPEKWHTTIHGLPVLGPPEMLLAQRPRQQFEMAIIAMPSASARRMGEVVKILQQAGLDFQTVPSLTQMATGRVKATQLRKVQVEDLLGRDQANLETEKIRGLIQGKTVMVTGAGGSIGSELCRQISHYHPARLLLLDQSEVQLFVIEQELRQRAGKGSIVPLMADVTDAARLRELFSRYQPALLYHAAAHKHVPMMEHQVGEALKNNTFGTMLLIDLALQHAVERFTFISTDKAVNPTSVMGATKRLAELYLQARHAAHPPSAPIRFLAVRFGNVLGSSGSVVRTFERQIADGGPVTVTHPEASRYFMTIPEAVGLVLQSSVMAEGGEIFVLDMGQPVKILDLARQMIELSGYTPGKDIEIKFVGLRDGEKLFEEINLPREDLAPTAHPQVLRFLGLPPAQEALARALGQLRERVQNGQPTCQPPCALKRMIRQIVPEYTPFLCKAENGKPKPEP